MAILQPYKVNSYRRLCDICGRPRQIEDIRFADGIAICTIHPQFRTAIQLNKINARVRPTRVLPVPQPKPFAPVDTWTAEESQIFKFITSTAPFDILDVTANAGAVTGVRTYQAIGWALVYLTGVLSEDKRPGPWITQARAKAIVLGDLLLSLQTQSTAQPFTPAGGLSTFLLTGTGTSAASQHTAIDVGLACAAFVRLYQAVGDHRYLQAARDAANFLVFLMAVDLRSGSSAAFYGPPAQGWSVNTSFFLSLLPTSLLAFWGMSLLLAVDGDQTVGPTTTAAQTGGTPGFFKSAPARLLSVAISQIRSFWTTGYGGVTGLSAATPWGAFDPSTRTWTTSSITTEQWAMGAFAFAEIDGASAQVVSLWTYLRSLTGNGIDATLAPATGFSGLTSTNTTAFYDWSTAGLLAKITSLRDRAGVKTIKDTIAVPRARFTEATPRSGDYLYLGPLGISTSTFAPFTSSTARQMSVSRASRVGFLYRQAPQGFTGQGH